MTVTKYIRMLIDSIVHIANNRSKQELISSSHFMGQNLIGKTLFDQFRVDEMIGSEHVYRVWDNKRNISLEMKALEKNLTDDPSFITRVKQEANALKKLAHPNIIKFYGLYQRDDFTFLLKQYVDGPTLKNILYQRKGQPLPFPEALIYLKALSAALDYVHSIYVVHSGVRPGNVIVDRDGNIYLTDFGNARLVESTSTTLVAVGSPAYMAPEQIRGEPVSPATDVYTLGILLFEMLTGQRPFLGTEEGTESSSLTGAVLYAHLHLQPPDPQSINPSLPNALVEVVKKALAKEPEERYQNMSDLFAATCAAFGRSQEDIPDRIHIRY